MSQVQTLTDLSNLEDEEDFRRFASSAIDAIVDIVNGNLEFGPNIKAQIIDINFTVVDTDTTVNHTLGYEPIAAIPLKKSGAGDLYKGLKGWSNTEITLRCTGLVSTKLLVF